MAEWRIERLASAHDRGEFCCGKAPLDEFLRFHVTQYEKRSLGRTFVAARPDETRVLGYYTLASGSLAFETLPRSAAKKLPRHPVPVALLARLAVDDSVQGQGLGAELLMDALHRCLLLSQELGVFAVEVDAFGASARSFYVKYGFMPLEDNQQHLYIPMKTIRDEFPT
jgi:GNAT superfamily N-acetyltransferase